MGICAVVTDVRRNSKIYDAWEQENQDNYARKRYLSQKNLSPEHIKKQKEIKDKANVVLRASSIMDNHSEAMAADAAFATGTIFQLVTIGVASLATLIPIPFIIKQIKKKKINNKKAQLLGTILPLVSGLAGTFAAICAMAPWMAKKQVEASRIGRFNAKQKDLSDIRNFVVYTEEQKKEADKNKNNVVGSNIQPAILKRNIQGAFQILAKTDNDYKAYKEWQKNNAGIDKKFTDKLTKEYNPSTIEDAKTDKEILLTGIKEVNNRAEAYSEDMEATFNTLGIAAQFATLPLIYATNKIVGKCKKVPIMTNQLISQLIPLVFTLSLAFYATNKAKEAARIGRFKAQQEFKEDTAKLTPYDESELKKVEHIKHTEKKKTWFQKIKDGSTFIFTKYKKDRQEYLKYIKNEYIENEKQQLALKKVSISEKQLKDAKDLQSKTFFVFDEVDEISQTYSENMEAAVGVGMSGVQLSGMVAFYATIFGVPMLLYNQARKGKLKLPIISTINKFANLMLKENSPLRKNINAAYDMSQKNPKLKQAFDSYLSTKESDVALKTKEYSKPQVAKIINEIATSLKNSTQVKSEIKGGLIQKWIVNLYADALKAGREKQLKVLSAKKEKTPEMLKQIKDL